MSIEMILTVSGVVLVVSTAIRIIFSERSEDLAYPSRWGDTIRWVTMALSFISAVTYIIALLRLDGGEL